MGTMTLIERLRALGFDGNELGHEAADEIERLRKPSNPDARTVTIIVPEGYANAEEFLRDCEFERAP